MNDAIRAVVPPERAVMPVPDFEAVAVLHGHNHEPARAWGSFAGIDRAQFLGRSRESTDSLSPAMAEVLSDVYLRGAWPRGRP